MEFLLIFIGAVFVNNIVLSQFLGICPLLGVSQRINTAAGMSGAVAFVMVISTIVTFAIQKLVLVPLGLKFMQTIVFILVIAFLVQLIEIILKKKLSALYRSFGIFLPLITTNCAILGVAIMVINKDYNFAQSIVFAFSSACGFGLALLIFSGIREQFSLTDDIPQEMQGTPVSLLTAGILAMAFMGFSGIV